MRDRELTDGELTRLAAFLDPAAAAAAPSGDADLAERKARLAGARRAREAELKARELET